MFLSAQRIRPHLWISSRFLECLGLQRLCCLLMGWHRRIRRLVCVSSRLSIRRRQHMLRTSSGFMSLLTKFEKYGTPYLAVTSKIACDTGESQSKSLVMLYVGIGKVKTLPFESPCRMTSAKAKLNISISLVMSPYVSWVTFPLKRTASFFMKSGTVKSKVKLVNGVWKPTRVGTFMLKKNS